MSRIDEIPKWKRLYKAAQAADNKFQAALMKEYGSRAGDMRYRTERQPPHIKKLGAAYRKKSIELSKMNEYYRTHTENPRRRKATTAARSTLLPAKVRINPRTGKVQVFVSPKVAAQVKGNRRGNPLQQWQVYIPPGRLGSYRLGFVAPNAADAKRRALSEYNSALSREGFPKVKSLPRGSKATIYHR